MDRTSEQNRQIYLDVLRIFATFVVILLHSSSTYMDDIPTDSMQWITLFSWNSLTHWAVGMFVMISGALFLRPGRRAGIKRIFAHNISHIAACFAVWSFGYMLLTVLTNGTPDTLATCLIEFIKGHYHMWFLYMIIGLYLLVPVLRKVAEEDRLIKYLTCIALVFGFLVPSIQQYRSILSQMGCPFMENDIWSMVDTSYGNMNIYFPLGYVGYFVLGYTLSAFDLKKAYRRLIYGWGVISLVLTFGCPFLTRMVIGSSIAPAADNMINTIGISASLFLYAKDHEKWIPSRMSSGIVKISDLSFGIYLAHAGVMEILDHPLQFNALTVAPLIGVPMVAIVVFLISGFITWFFKKIPVLKKLC